MYRSSKRCESISSTSVDTLHSQTKLRGRNVTSWNWRQQQSASPKCPIRRWQSHLRAACSACRPKWLLPASLAHSTALLALHRLIHPVRPPSAYPAHYKTAIGFPQCWISQSINPSSCVHLTLFALEWITFRILTVLKIENRKKRRNKFLTIFLDFPRNFKRNRNFQKNWN